MCPSEDDEPQQSSRPHRAIAGHAEMQNIARAEVIRGWEELGVAFRDPEKRQEFAGVLDWVRKRKKSREAAGSKIVTATVGSIVTALVGAAVAMLTGKGHF